MTKASEVILGEYPAQQIRERLKFNAWKKVIKTLDKLPGEDRQCIIKSVTILFMESENDKFSKPEENWTYIVCNRLLELESKLDIAVKALEFIRDAIEAPAKNALEAINEIDSKR